MNGKKIGTFSISCSSFPGGCMKFFLLTAAIILFTATLFSQQSVTITASKDNTLYETPDGSLSDGSGSYLFVGRTNQSSNSLRRAVIKFDLVGKLPENAVIVLVKLTLNLSKTKTSASNVNIHRMITDWGEGTSDADENDGGGAASATNDATWLHRFFSTQSWITPGGDFNPSKSAQLSVNNIGLYTWQDTLMRADVVSWLQNPSANFGWILIGNETGQSSKRFDSRSATTSSTRPQLIVQFTVPTTVNKIPSQPEVFSLEQNFPNPFNPSTTISFSIPENGQTTVKVYDVLGNEMATLINQYLAAGPHSVKFDAAALSSGIYFYRLHTSGLTATRKLLLVK